MKKLIKILIIVIVAIGLIIGAVLLFGKKIIIDFITPPSSSETLTSEEIKADELSQIVYDSIPYEVYDNVTLKNQFENYSEYYVKYESSDINYLTNTGVVSRDIVDHSISITYTISTNNFSKTYMKPVIVKALEGNQIIEKVIYELFERVPLRPNNGFELPLTSLTVSEATLKWDLNIYKDEGKNEVEESIKIIENDGVLSLEFTSTGEERLCYLNVDITYGSLKMNQNIPVYTKI